VARCSVTRADGEACRASAMHGSDRCAGHLALGATKTKLTAELTDQIAAVIGAGNHIEVACRAVSLPRRTFNDWMARGESSAPRDQLYRRFRDRIGEARARGEVRLVSEVSKAARENWAAAAWMLERAYPERWARVSQRAQVQQPEAAPEPRPADPFDEVDELASRRRGHTG
jgi:hypothetical protein